MNEEVKKMRESLITVHVDSVDHVRLDESFFSSSSFFFIASVICVSLAFLCIYYGVTVVCVSLRLIVAVCFLCAPHRRAQWCQRSVQNSRRLR